MRKVFAGFFVVLFSFAAVNSVKADEVECYAEKVMISINALNNSFRSIQDITQSMGSSNDWMKVAMISGRLKQATKTAELINAPAEAGKFQTGYEAIINNYEQAAEHFKQGALLRSESRLMSGLRDFKRGNRQLNELSDFVQEETY